MTKIENPIGIVKTANDQMTRPANEWIYERGEGRTKHCWSEPFAGFKPSQRGQVGKCSNKITDAVATKLLNNGINDTGEQVGREDGVDYPSKIYTVHDGAIYVAVPTCPGISYHGYPVRGRLPRKLVAKLRQKATESDCLREFEKWVREYIE